MTHLAVFDRYAEEARRHIPPGRVDWSTSPFGWMRHHGPRTKSKLGRDIVEAWLRHEAEARGLAPWRTSDDGVSHFVVRDRSVVVHFAIQGKEGMLEFANLREPNMGADRLWLLGIEPRRVRLWSVLPSAMIGLPSYANDAPGYHNTSIDPDEPPEWAREIGVWVEAEQMALA